MDYLTITEAAKQKGCTRVTIYKWLNEGRLNVYEVAGRRFVVNDEKLAALQSGRAEDGGRLSRLEERLAKLEAGNEALRSMAEKTLAKLAALEKQGKINTKDSARIKNQ